MNVSCEGILMRYVSDEKEAFAEIRRYLDVNHFIPQKVSICEVEIYDKQTDQRVEIAKKVATYDGSYSSTQYRRFLIRGKTKPPFDNISQVDDDAHFISERERIDAIKNEMANYIAAIQYTSGGAPCH